MIEVEILHVTQKGIRLKPTLYRQSSIKNTWKIHVSINFRNLGYVMHPTTQGSVTWTAAINLKPSKYSTHLFWTHSKQVFPLYRKWFKLEPRLCPVCSAEITGPADALWVCVLICADADSQYLLIPTLVSTGHRTDVGDYKGGFREAGAPSVCGSNLLWRRRKARWTFSEKFDGTSLSGPENQDSKQMFSCCPLIERKIVNHHL